MMGCDDFGGKGKNDVFHLVIRYCRILLISVCFMVAGGVAMQAATAGATAEDVAVLSIWQAAVLGLVEGATEYLPVSSTGHLLLTERLLGIADDPQTRDAANAYAIVIQAGAILAVLGLYRQRVAQMLRGLRGRDPAGRQLAVNLVVAFIPAAVFGLLFGEMIKQVLFGLWPVTLAWLLGGIALLVVPTRRGAEAPAGNPLEQLTWRQALGIGLLQCAALWPGVSRSLATIAGGLLVGLELVAAVEFSFLLGLVTLGAATVYETLQSGALIVSAFGWQAPLIGFLCALVSAWVAVRWMVGFLQQHGLGLFGWYRISLALVVALGLMSGWIVEL